jgi:hypothetical protein
MESKRPLLVRTIAKTRLEAAANKNKSDQRFLLINLLALSFNEKSEPNKVVEGPDGFQPEGKRTNEQLVLSANTDCAPRRRSSKPEPASDPPGRIRLKSPSPSRSLNRPSGPVTRERSSSLSDCNAGG